MTLTWRKEQYSYGLYGSDNKCYAYVFNVLDVLPNGTVGGEKRYCVSVQTDRLGTSYQKVKHLYANRYTTPDEAKAEAKRFVKDCLRRKLR